MKKLIHEIHRRSLWQVLGIYIGGSWGALQVVDLLVDNFGLPPWFPGLALALLVLGLPIVLATAFVQEGRAPAEPGPQPAASTAQPAPHHLLTWRNAVIGGVGAFALWGAVALGWLLLGPDLAPAGTGGGGIVRSIAVLPFATRSDDKQDEYFAEGMHDDLLTQLAKIDSLTVISRTSVMQYAGTTKSIRDIGRELGVAAVLEGGIQRAGDHVRVNVQLIDANSDSHLWADTYDEELTAANVFAIQSNLARDIASALRATLSPAVERRLETHPTESLEAWDLYARARYAYVNRATFGEGIEETRALFEQAIAADSSFAPAWAGLGNVHLAAGNWNRVPMAEALPPARAAIERALALDPENADALVARSRLLSFEGDLDAAEVAIRRALELSPGDPEANTRMGLLLQERQRYDEAVAAIRRAVQLDPISVPIRQALSDVLFFTGDFEGSIAESLKTLEMAPGDWYALYNLGWARAALGQGEQAVDAFHQSLDATTDNTATVRAGLAFAFARAGMGDSARAQLAQLRPAEVGYDYTLTLLELGDADAAFTELEALLRQAPGQVGRIERDPTAGKLRADPRWADLVRRFGRP